MTCRLCDQPETGSTKYAVMRGGEVYTSVTHATCERHREGLTTEMVAAGWVVRAPEQHIVASRDRCIVHPQHVMVNQGRSERHYADLFVCACGRTDIGKRDDSRVRYAR